MFQLDLTPEAIVGFYLSQLGSDFAYLHLCKTTAMDSGLLMKTIFNGMHTNVGVTVRFDLEACFSRPVDYFSWWCDLSE